MDDCHALLQECLDELRAGNSVVREKLIDAVEPAVRRIACVRFKRFPRLRGWETPDDVAQIACYRLWRALDHVAPATVQEFMGLAAEQVRRVLLDMTRRCFGKEGFARHLAGAGQTQDGEEEAARPHDDSELAEWTQLHEAIAALPADEREVAKLMWYGQATLRDVARRLGLSRNTIQRRWQRARERLREIIAGTPR